MWQAEIEDVAKRMRGTFQTVEDMTESFLREAISRGLYAPGERLQQDAIASVLGVSRMPVRASLRQLESEGLLSIVPHRGAVVSILGAQEIAEIYQLRILVESYLLDRALERVTTHDIGELAALAEALDEAHESDSSSAERLERRRRFYERLYEISDSARATRIVQQLRDAVGRYLLLQRVDETSHHQEVLNYLENRDRNAAQAWLVSHLTRVSKRLQELVAADE